MLYRETGQFKTSYKKDMVIFPIRQDRWGMAAVLIFVAVGVPLIATEHVIAGYLIPLLIWAIAAIGLNILTGYTGQLSLGHGAFMAVGAYSAYNLASRIPELPIILVFLLAGLIAAIFGILVGSPSLRIKGFYLAVATLAAQFFVEWVFATFSWFVGGAADFTAYQVLCKKGSDHHEPKDQIVIIQSARYLITEDGHLGCINDHAGRAPHEPRKSRKNPLHKELGSQRCHREIKTFDPQTGATHKNTKNRGDQTCQQKHQYDR